MFPPFVCDEPILEPLAYISACVPSLRSLGLPLQFEISWSTCCCSLAPKRRPFSYKHMQTRKRKQRE